MIHEGIAAQQAYLDLRPGNPFAEWLLRSLHRELANVQNEPGGADDNDDSAQ